MKRDEKLIDILTEWQMRSEGGEEVDLDQLVAAHPGHEEALRAHFAVMSALDAPIEAALPPTPSAIGEYRIVREIGRGGMGIVYEAEQERMKRRVALKVLSTSITTTPHAVRRFQREAQAAGRLHHTNIVPIYDLDHHAGQWFYAMELVEGRSLSGIVAELRRRRPTERRLARAAVGHSVSSSDVLSRTGTGARSYYRRVAELFAGVAEALDLAHQEGVVHRDIKPSNLLLDVDGVLKIVDFGLARCDDEAVSMTATGDLLGTPQYMSPEQAMAKRMGVDHRTDIYSLGATLYEVVTLAPPFDAESIQELCSQIITKDPMLARRRNRQVPRDLETIICKAMEKDRDRRYQSARDFARDLRAFESGEAIRARRIGVTGRVWRKAKRHKVRTALISALLLAGVVSGVLVARGRHAAAVRLQQEYAQLCARGFEASWLLGAFKENDRPLLEQGENAVPFFDSAIALLPERPDAYLGRALAGGRTTTERLRDLEAAHERGLSKNSAHLTRAEIWHLELDWERAAAEEEQIEPGIVAGSLDLLLAGRLLANRGDYPKAIDKMTGAIDACATHDPIRYLAYRARARVRELTGDLEGALQDLAAARAGGDDSILSRVRVASLWFRMGRKSKAAAMFQEVLESVRREGSESAWTELRWACGRQPEWLRTREWHRAVSEEAVSLFPGSGHFWASSAFGLADAKPDLALQHADKAVDLAPGDSRAHSARAQALRRLGRPDEALAAAERAVELEPRRVSRHMQRAYVLYDLGNHSEALRVSTRASELQPWWSEPHKGRALALMKLGRLEEALREARVATRCNPQCHKAAHVHASVLIKSQRWIEALRAFDRALVLDPKCAEAHTGRAIALAKLGRYQDMRSAFDAAFAVDPKSVVNHRNRCVLLLNLKRPPAELLEAAERGLVYHNADTFLNRARGEALYALGKRKEALAAFERALELAPRESILYAKRGWTLVDLGDYATAKVALEKAIELGYEEGWVYEGLAAACWGLTRRPACLKACDAALTLGQDSSRVLHMRGMILNDLGRYEEALPALRKAIKREPLARAYAGMARALHELKRPDEARAAIRKALESGSEDAFVHETRGFLLSKCDPQEAVVAFRRAVELAPQWVTAINNLGLCLLDIGREDEGYEMLEKATLAGWPDANNACALAQRRLSSDPDLAVRLAGKAVGLAPRNELYRRTLAIAYVRAGRHQDALKELQACLKLTNGTPCQYWFLIAAARERAGLDGATDWYRKAVAWMDEHEPDDEELKRLRAKAEEVLGIKGE